MRSSRFNSRTKTKACRTVTDRQLNARFPSRFKNVLIILATVLAGIQLQAYPEFQDVIVKASKKPVNCALCHVHHDGPEGTAPGQIGHLNPAEQEKLGRARAAFDPGANPDSPILNRFGNHIIHSIGKKTFLELRIAPAELANALPAASDLDFDGIPDVREYLQGTHPLDGNDGHPWLLFKFNFKRYFSEILLALTATVAGVWGLAHLLRGFAIAAQAKEDPVSRSGI